MCCNVYIGISINRNYAYCVYDTDPCGIRCGLNNRQKKWIYMNYFSQEPSKAVLLSFFVNRFFAASQRRHTPSKRRHTPNLCARNPRTSITFSASMLELRLRRNGLKREIRKSGSGREKEMEKRKMKGGRADERAGIHSQVGEKHTCPNPLLLAAVFLST